MTLSIRNLYEAERMGWRLASRLSLLLAVSVVSAAETNTPVTAAQTPKVAATNAPAAAVTNAAPASATNTAPVSAPPMTPEQMFEGGTNAYSNWIEFGVGGFITTGNKSQFEQRNQNTAGPFGGIEDLHYQANIAKGTTMTLDGRGIFDEHDYKLNLAIDKEKLGYVHFSASEFRTRYNGDGGFYPPTGAYYSYPGDALALDRGDFSIEAGLNAGQSAQGDLQVRAYLPGRRGELHHLGLYASGRRHAGARAQPINL